MSVVSSRETLAFQLNGRPATRQIDISRTLCGAVASKMKSFSEKNGHAVPEVEALWFYMMNHATAVVRQRKQIEEQLAELAPILEKHHEVLNLSARRMFYYLLAICAREARHASVSGELRQKLSKKFGSGVSHAITSFPDENNMQKVCNVLDTKFGDVPLGNLTGALVQTFNEAGFGGGFGGPAWGKVAEFLHNFVTGVFSAEMMLDTAWTLCHNNGPIFNKGMLYGHYDKVSIMTILDVQRAGQIPQLVAEAKVVAQFMQPALRAAHQQYLQLLGEEAFGGFVDWQHVEDSGAKQSYSQYKKMMPAGMAAKENKFFVAIPKHKMFKIVERKVA